MSRNVFGWSLPPGVTQRQIDEAFGGDTPPCETCGGDPATCDCPECPICHEVGNPYCYDQGHIKPTTAQLIGQAKLHIHELQNQLADEEAALLALEYKLDQEKGNQNDNGPKA